ncbi:MAG: helix-turn-helix domain-containing protein [Capsulimonadaceae bacterium]
MCVSTNEHEIVQRFGERVRELRSNAGYSQESFALACDIDRSYMGQIERGEFAVTLRTQCRIAHCLGITMSELLNGIEG